MGGGDLEKRVEELAARLARLERQLGLPLTEEPPKGKPATPPETGSTISPESASQINPAASEPPLSEAPTESSRPAVSPGSQPRKEPQPASQSYEVPTGSKRGPDAPNSADHAASSWARKESSLPKSPAGPDPPGATYSPSPGAGREMTLGPTHDRARRRDSQGLVDSGRPKAPMARGEDSIEFAIGGKLAAWAGAIIVVLGTAFAIREYGAAFWFGLPNVVQAFLIACFGGALLFAGEAARVKIGRRASVGLFGAGLGVLYLDACAAFAWFDPAIVSSNVAFVLMALVALCGFAVTLRTRFRPIGALSLVGGYLAPVLLANGGGAPLLAFSYLTMIAAIGLGLAAALPQTFRALRGLALGGQIIVGLMLVLAFPANWIAALIFITIWWAMFVAESTFAALHDRSPDSNALITLLVTAAYVTCASWVLQSLSPAGPSWLGAFTLGVAIVSAAIAAQISTGLHVLGSKPVRATDRLAIALYAQAGVLLVVAAAMQFDGYGASVSWLAIALAAIEIGRRVDSKGATVFGLIVGALACFRITTIDPLSIALQDTLWSWRDLLIDRWAVLGLLAIGAVHVAARRIATHRGDGWPAMPILLAAVATTAWVLWCVRQMDGLTLTAGWLVGSVALLKLTAFGTRQRFFEIGLLLLVMTAGKWLIIDAFLQRLDPAWDATATLPVLNAQMGLAVAIALAGWKAFSILRRPDEGASSTENAGLEEGHAGVNAGGPVHPSGHPPSKTGSEPSAVRYGSEPAATAWPFLVLSAALFVLVAFSFEIDRHVMRLAQGAEPLFWTSGHLRQILLTMLWSAGAFGIGLLGLLAARDSKGGPFAARLLLGAAWFLIAGCFAKWVLLDTLVWHSLGSRDAAREIWLLGNAQMFAGLLLAASAIALMIATSKAFSRRNAHEDATSRPWSRLTRIVPPAAALLVIWGLSFEMDRLLSRLAADESFIALWPHPQWVALWLTGLWAVGGMAMMLIGRWRAIGSMVLYGWVVIALAAGVWLVFDTVQWRFEQGVVAAPVIFNLQFGIGLVTAAMLAAGMMLVQRMHEAEDFAGLERRQISEFRAAQGVSGPSLLALIGFWLGSFEIDRGFIDNPMARQMGWSVFWSLYGAGLVLLGFIRLRPAARYAGLALLCITVGKVFVIDLSQVDQIWRVVSFVVLGLLLLAISVAYTRLAPRLLRNIEGRSRR